MKHSPGNAGGKGAGERSRQQVPDPTPLLIQPFVYQLYHLVSITSPLRLQLWALSMPELRPRASHHTLEAGQLPPTYLAIHSQGCKCMCSFHKMTAALKIHLGINRFFYFTFSSVPSLVLPIALRWEPGVLGQGHWNGAGLPTLELRVGLGRRNVTRALELRGSPVQPAPRSVVTRPVWKSQRTR